MRGKVMNSILNKLKGVLLISATLFTAASAYSNDLFAGQLQDVNLKTQKVQVSDSMYYFDEFTVVRRNGSNEGVRMPISSLREGMWVVVVPEYSDRFEGFMARQIWLFPSESSAKQFQNSVSED